MLASESRAGQERPSRSRSSSRDLSHGYRAGDVIRCSSSSAPRLDSGSLRFPHFGDCTHEGSLAARALTDQSLRVPDEPLELVIAAPGDPHSAGMALVDEDGRPTGLWMGVDGEAADVPAVTHGDQRQDRDLPVLQRVQRTQQQLGRERERSSAPAISSSSSYHRALVANSTVGRSSV